MHFISVTWYLYFFFLVCSKLDDFYFLNPIIFQWIAIDGNSPSISVSDCPGKIYPIIEYVFDNFPQVRWVAHRRVLSCLKDRITQRGCYRLRSSPSSPSAETLTTTLNVTLSQLFNQSPFSLLITLPSTGRAQLHKSLGKNVAVS